MSYCTLQDLKDLPGGEEELIQRTDRDGLGVINQAVIDKAIAFADAEINGYLTAYRLPLSAVPENFAGIACDLALYYLYRGFMIDEVEKRYNSRIKYLEKIAAGSIKLAADVSGSSTPPADAGIEFSSSAPVFGRMAY